MSALILGFVGKAQAQTTVNVAGWYGYEGYHSFTEGEPWGLLFEGYVKRNNVVTDKQGLFGRIGINYELPRGHRITGGYAVQYNYPYDEASLPYNWADHGIWEQFLWRHASEARSGAW